MTTQEYLEFITMLLVERASQKMEKFEAYMDKRCEVESFNSRYKELLDKFLNNYALNKTEKSE